MNIEFAFGKTGLSLALPEGFDYCLLEARSASALPDQLAAIEYALDHPIGRPPLMEMARGKKTAAISVCDITRPAPNKLTLPPILRRLEAAGIGREQTTICIATGLHREASQAEIREILGDEIAAGYRIVNHHAKVLSEHRHLGSTSTGTPVYIEEQFMTADLHITLGFIEPHLMLGYSGGRKLIAPGLAAQETIKVLHSPKFMRDARAHEGSIEDNPLHRELLEIASMARHDFMLDVALTRKREIAGVFAGDGVEAHRAGVQFVSRVMLELLDHPVDAVITTCAGYPLDLTFYQAIKGITAAQHIVKPGGKILLLAACTEGTGAEEFTAMMRAVPDADVFLNTLESAPVVVDQWQLEKLAMVTRKVDMLYYVPGVAADYYPSLWGNAFGTGQEALAALVADLPANARVAVIPEGPYVLAKVEEHAAAR